ncbi:MAG: penicillin-binding protein 1A [Alphaproteobacteria bacterium]|nr:penicillin-binding protein 1A [Alphaproteobacteria bacterium]
MIRHIRRFFAKLLILACIASVIGGGVAAFGVWYISQDLPAYDQLVDYYPATLTRVHANDGRVMAEFARERRIFVPIDQMPRRVINAFLAAEDKSFYSHPGISVPDILRATFQNLVNYNSNRRPIGASTITQQVARNFLLGDELSITRKVREAILALRIEQALSKDRILELYLNEIFLGGRSFGVAAAALNYFNRTLDELSIAEIAYLAALPKAPSNYHPVRRYEAAVGRRDWVLGRMLEDGHITQAEYQEARAQPLATRQRGPSDIIRADYFAEEVRRDLLARFGEDQLYRGGLSVRTSLDTRMQEAANRALRNGLIAYDRRHGWRGPVSRIVVGPGWERRLAQVHAPAGLAPWRLAVVIALADGGAEVGLTDGSQGLIPFSEMQWARPWRENQRVGNPPRNAGDVVQPGDVVAVEPIDPPRAPVAAAPAGRGRAQTAALTTVQPDTPPTGEVAQAPRARQYFGLRQIPNVSGAIVAMDPHTGRVLAMTGGWSFDGSQFNRATQALRQPGSSFKPFVYLAALENGFTPSSLILDGPIALDQGAGQNVWQPENASRTYLGPTTLRRGIELSRNLMTVRLGMQVGIDVVASYVERFGIMDRMPQVLSMVLGAGETTLMRMVTAYGELANGGVRITPQLIDRVQDRNGNTIFRADQRECANCAGLTWRAGLTAPELPDPRERILDPITAFQIVNIMTGVTTRGTAAQLAALGRPLAGKTGTTNEAKDAWFVGFSPDLVAGVYVGFDQPRPLGQGEEGGRTAVPIFREFIAEALRDTPIVQFRQPQGVRMVRVSLATGQPVRGGERDAIMEAFRPGQDPTSGNTILDGGLPVTQTPGSEQGDSSGLY